MTEKAPIPVLGFDCGKLPPDLLAKFGESAASIPGLTLDEWAQKITEGDGIQQETAS